MLNTNKLLLAVAIATALTGCGSEKTKYRYLSTSSSGTAVDGYLAGATARCDSNEDGVVTADSQTAITNDQGEFVFSPQCDHTIIVSGGVNKVSDTVNYPFMGQLKAPAGAKMATPLTTMMVESGLTSDQLAALLGLPAGTDLTTVDPTSNVAVNKATLAIAQTMQTLAATFGATPGDFSVYAKIAKQLGAQLADPAAAPLFNADGTIDSTAVSSLVSATASKYNNTLPTLDRLTTSELNTVTTALVASASAYLDPAITDISALETLATTGQNPDTAPAVSIAEKHFVFLESDLVMLNGTPVKTTDLNAETPEVVQAAFQMINFNIEDFDMPTFGKTVNVALSIELASGTKTEMLLTDVVVSANNSLFKVDISETSKVYAHATTTGESAAEANVILNNAQTLNILKSSSVDTNFVFNFSEVSDRLSRKNSAFDELKSITGVTKFKFAVSGLNFRKVDKSAYSVVNISVPGAVDASGNAVAGVTGYGLQGSINFDVPATN